MNWCTVDITDWVTSYIGKCLLYISNPACLDGHCWRSRDELIRDVLLWIPTHGRAKAGRPARTYIQQLCEDTGCSPEDLPRAMNDREEWRERVRDIRAASTIWWWWWYFHPDVKDGIYWDWSSNPNYLEKKQIFGLALALQLGLVQKKMVSSAYTNCLASDPAERPISCGIHTKKRSV